jgi:large subunit ribosomal protein L22
MKAILRNARMSPRKVSLIADLVRGKKATTALTLLKFSPQKGAALLYETVKSAVANAQKNFKQNPENLIIKEIKVGKSLNYKRFMPVSRGRAHPIIKRGSNIHVYLETVAPEKTKETKNEKTTQPIATEKEKPVTKTKKTTKSKKETSK